MKKLLLSLTMLTLLGGTLFAQQEVFSAKLNQDEVPAVVLKAIEQDFPNMIASNFHRIPVEFLDGSFVLTSNTSDLPGEEITYVVTMQGPGFNAEATYNGDGMLMSAKEFAKNVPLPLPVERAIYKAHPGWTVGKDYELLTINHSDQQKAYYRVQLSKGKEKEMVTYDAHGNETKAGKVRGIHKM